MTPYELIETIDKVSNTKKETVEDVNDLLVQMMDNPRKFTNQLANELDEYCGSNSICPRCGSKLELLKLDKVQEEYQGFLADRNENTYGCKKCGYVIK